MLPVLIGAWRLAEVARQARVRAMVYDTSGLINPGRGGIHLKQAMIDLPRPDDPIEFALIGA